MKLKNGLMADDFNIDTFLSVSKSCLIAPAGFGKTHTIASAIKKIDGKQLVLTHTNRGVDALKRKFLKLKIPKEKYIVKTISSFAKAYTSAYPIRSETNLIDEIDLKYWSKLNDGLIKLLDINFVKKIIKNTYSGIFVDEYQDCNQKQHQMVMKLSEILPTRLLGDPLQGIYNFDKDTLLVDMEADIPGEFIRFELTYPWRWTDNIEFGEWLKQLRDNLLQGKEIDLSTAPSGFVNFIEFDGINFQDKNNEIRLAANTKGTVVVIEKINHQCHKLAKSFNGQYQSDEEINSNDLFYFADSLDKSTNSHDKACAVFWMTTKCYCNFRTKFARISDQFIKYKTVVNSKKYKNVTDKLKDFLKNGDIRILLNIMDELEKYHLGLYRRELWHDSKGTIELFINQKFNDFKSSAKHLRSVRSIISRPPPKRLISRVYLVKGLEFDRGLIINPEKFKTKELYVALTRASHHLTIIGPSPIFKPHIKKTIIKYSPGEQLKLI